MPKTMTTDSAISLLLNAARISSPLRDAVLLVEDRIRYLEGQLQQAYQCCARPAGVCFDPLDNDGSEVSTDE